MTFNQMRRGPWGYSSQQETPDPDRPGVYEVANGAEELHYQYWSGYFWGTAHLYPENAERTGLNGLQGATPAAWRGLLEDE